MAADFARCLKPGGLLLLHTTNFRFCDTSVFEQFIPVLEAEPGQMAADVLFDRHNRLMEGECYRAVVRHAVALSTARPRTPTRRSRRC